MVRRTTINLDMDLVAGAREVLETKNTTDTVHAALREVVRRRRLESLAEWDLGGKTLEDLKELRRSRVETRPWGRWRDEFDVMDVFRGGRVQQESEEGKPTASAASSGPESQAVGRPERDSAATG